MHELQTKASTRRIKVHASFLVPTEQFQVRHHLRGVEKRHDRGLWLLLCWWDVLWPPPSGLCRASLRACVGPWCRRSCRAPQSSAHCCFSSESPGWHFSRGPRCCWHTSHPWSSEMKQRRGETIKRVKVMHEAVWALLNSNVFTLPFKGIFHPKIKTRHHLLTLMLFQICMNFECWTQENIFGNQTVAGRHWLLVFFPLHTMKVNGYQQQFGYQIYFLYFYVPQKKVSHTGFKR